MDFLDLLPPELIERIFYFLPIDDLLSVSRVSVSWYIASNSSRLWRAAIKQSSSRDRFIKLSDLDKFNGISSNYDSDHSFNVEKPSTSCLPPMNPWKLSLCQHNFVQNNLRGGRPNLKLARHEIALEDDMVICEMSVIFPSKSAHDGLYLPILGRKRGETAKTFHLIRLDGVPKVLQLFTTEAEINYACIDRYGIVWLEDDKVNYLPFVENFNSSQSKNLGSLCLESDDTIINKRYLLTMDTKHFAVGYKLGLVKIWCRKTCKLEITITPEENIQSFTFNNGHFYLALSRFGVHEHNYLDIYDVKQDKLISVLDAELPTECIVFGAKYYAIVPEELSDTLIICVREINTNTVMFYITVRGTILLNNRVWFVDDYFLYVDDVDLKVLSLVDWTVSDSLRLLEHSYLNYIIDLDVIDTCLFFIGFGYVDVWDWKLGRKLHEIARPRIEPFRYEFHVNETRLVSVGYMRSVDVVGFW